MLTTENKTDWGKIILIAIFFFASIFGMVLTKISGNILFVKRIGADFLPYTYIANAILSLIVALFIAGNINRFNLGKIFKIISIIGIISYFGIYFLLTQKLYIAYPLYIIYGNLFYAILTGIFIWEITLRINTNFETRKNSGYFNLGASFGGILAGGASSFLGSKLGTDFLIIPIIISQFIALITVFIISHKHNEKLKAGSIEKKGSSGINELKEGFCYLKKNNLSKLIFSILIIYGIIGWLADFEFQKILSEKFDEEKFSQIVGFVSIAENIILFIIFLLLQKWILTRLGIMKALLLAPIFIFIPFAILLFIPAYYIAIALKLTDTATYRSLFSSPMKLIFSAIPRKISSNVSTLIKASTESISTLMAGIGLILLTKFLGNNWIIILGIGLIVISIVIIIYIKKSYIRQITINLESEDLKDVHASIENFAEPSYHKIGVIELMKLIENKKLENETIRKIVFALGKIDNVKVIPSLLELFEKYDITIKYSVIEAIHSFSDINKDLEPLPFTRMNILDTYKSIFLKEEDPDLKIFILKHLKNFNESEIINFLKDAMRNKNPGIQNQAIKAMRYFNDRGIIKYIKPFLKNENIRTQASAIIALWQFTEMRPKLLQLFIPIISNKEKDYVLTALYIISKLKFTWELHYVLEKLNDKDATIKTMAGLTLTQLNDKRGIETIIKPLTEDITISRIVARNIKNMPTKIKENLFKELNTLDEKAIENCIQILKSTYLNFTEEIRELKEKQIIHNLHK